jgi:flagellar basal body-associated protein FliL
MNTTFLIVLAIVALTAAYFFFVDKRKTTEEKVNNAPKVTENKVAKPVVKKPTAAGSSKIGGAGKLTKSRFS